MRSVLHAAGLAAVLFGFPSGAAAIPITSAPGLEGLGSFIGTFVYDPTDFELTISLTNQSAPGGKLVALAFNNPGDAITGVSLTSSDADFQLLGGANFDDGISVSPFGSADIGSSITTEWLGGGSPNPGIAVGNSATFTFTFTGTGLGSLTEQDFIDTLPTGGGATEWLLVRFRGFDNDGSDKVGTNVPEPEITTHAPEPASLLMLGGGMLALAAHRRRPQRS